MSESREPYGTPEQIAENFRRWYSAMEISDVMLMSGLRDKVGPDGDIDEAYRQWNDKRRATKMRAYWRAAERYRQSGKENGSRRETLDAS